MSPWLLIICIRPENNISVDPSCINTEYFHQHCALISSWGFFVVVFFQKKWPTLHRISLVYIVLGIKTLTLRMFCWTSPRPALSQAGCLQLWVTSACSHHGFLHLNCYWIDFCQNSRSSLSRTDSSAPMTLSTVQLRPLKVDQQASSQMVSG